MIREITNFKRKELFEHYHKFDNPFIICTVKIDVTNIVKYCQKHKNFYATFAYAITKTANDIDAFKYRYKDGKFYYCDELKTNFTEMFKDNTTGYFGLPFNSNLEEYLENFKKNQKKFKEDNKYTNENTLNELWFSCTPWFSFTSLIPTYSKEITIPQIIWDKYENSNNKYYVNLMIVIHHGFADGYHIGEFIKLLEKNINEFN